MNESGRARVLNGADDGVLFAAAAWVARETAGTARVYSAGRGRGTDGGPPSQVAETDGSVVGGGSGRSDVAVEQLGGGDAVDAVVGSVAASVTRRAAVSDAASPHHIVINNNNNKTCK